MAEGTSEAFISDAKWARAKKGKEITVKYIVESFHGGKQQVAHVTGTVVYKDDNLIKIQRSLPGEVVEKTLGRDEVLDIY